MQEGNRRQAGHNTTSVSLLEVVDRDVDARKVEHESKGQLSHQKPFIVQSLHSLFSSVDVLSRLPDHDDVVLCRARHRPLHVWAPRDIPGLAGVTSVDKQQLGRSVVRVVGRLLLPNLGDVPDVDPSVRRGGREDGLRVGRPGELDDLVGVRLERVQLLREFAEIPESDRLREKRQDEKMSSVARREDGT